VLFLLLVALSSPAHDLLGSFVLQSPAWDLSMPLLHFIYIGLETKELKQYRILVTQFEEDRQDNRVFLQLEKHLNDSRSSTRGRGRKQSP